MEITNALLCDFAQVREGLLFVASGGITRVFRPDLPAPLGVMLAVVVELQPDEMELAHELKVIVKQNARAKTLATLTGGFQAGVIDLEPGETLQVPMVLGLGFPVDDYGAHDVHIAVDNDEPRILTFYVLDQAKKGS